MQQLKQRFWLSLQLSRPVLLELSLSQIMTQKYIALFGFGFLETWNDMRKYHYDANIYKGLTFTSSLYPDNAGKLAYRIRPRYNSEYVWNLETLKNTVEINLSIIPQSCGLVRNNFDKEPTRLVGSLFVF